MALMPSRVASSTEEFHLNREAYLARVADLQRRRSEASAGGPERARRLHKERKQLLPRERVAALIDPGSPFLSSRSWPAKGCTRGCRPVAASSPASAWCPVVRA